MAGHDRVRKLFNQAPFLKSLHGWLAVHWAAHIPVVILMYFIAPRTWAKVSILYLALVSIYANFVTHLGVWQSARSEIAAEKAAS